MNLAMDFFVSLKKYNKTAFFVLLAFVLFGIFTPDFRHANAIWPFTNVAEGISSLIRTVSEGLTSIMSSMAIIRHVIAAPGTFILAIWGLLARLLGVLAFFWALFFAAIFQVILYIFIQTDALSITKNTVFLTAWNQAKLYANMFIVLELIAAALMMILNLKMWGEPKKMVITVIAIALLVNFSIVVVGVMIDVSNILMAHLLLRGSSIAGIIGTVDEAWNQTLLGLPSTFISLEDTAMYMIMNFFFFGLYMVIGLAFIYFIFIFFQRYIYLAILFILSPLAFAAYSFPQTKHLFSQWWHHLLRNCFLGVEAAFFLKLSVDILHAGTGGLTNNNSDFLTQVFNNPMLSTVISGTTLTFMFNALFLVIVVIGFLLFGLRMAAKTAGPLADIVMAAVAAITVAVVEAIVTGGASLAASAEGLAASGAQMAMKGAGKAVGAVTGSDALEKKFSESKILQEEIKSPIKTGATKLGEAIGVLPEGSAKASVAKENDRKVDQWRPAFSNQNDVQQLINELRATSNEFKKAAIVERLAQLNAIDAIGTPAEQRTEIQNAIKNGVSANKVLAQSADNADLDENRVKEERRKLEPTVILGTTKDRNGNVISTAAEKETYLKEESEYRARQYYFARMDNADIKKLDNDALLKLAEKETAEGAKALEEAIQRNIIGKVKGGNIDQQLKLLDHAKVKYGSSAKKDAAKIDPRLAGFSIDEMAQRIDQLEAMGVPVSDSMNQAKRESAQKVSEAYEKLTVAQIRELSVSALNEDFIENTTAKKIGNAGKDMAREKIQKLKSQEVEDWFLDQLTQAIASKDTARQKELTDKFRAIVVLT